MKIEVLRKKVHPTKEFDPRVNVVLSTEKFPNILEKLNAIIDWDKSDFPNDPKTRRVVKQDVTEKIEMIKAMAIAQGGQEEAEKLIDSLANGQTNIMGIGVITEENGRYYTEVVEYDQERDFLGPEPSLQPGDCFKWDGVHSFGVCEVEGVPTLGLMRTGTGIRVIERFAKEHIIPEYNFNVRSGMIDFSISEVEFLDPSKGECLLLNPDETDLSRYISEPDVIFPAIKLNYGDWRFLLRGVENLKDILNKLPRIIHITCMPLFEEAEVWIDKYGNIVFNVGEFCDMIGMEREELFEYLLPALKEYLESHPDIVKNIIPQLPQEETEEELEDID